MASLTGTKIKDTYDALLKVSDNGALDGTLQTITDGLGNNSALSLSTAGASVGGTLAVSGNAAFDTNTLFVDAANNRVGVGTASPTLALSVVGQVRAGESTTAGLTIGLSPVSVPNNDLNAYIVWGSAPTFGGNNGDLIYVPRTSTAADHRFYAGSGAATEKMRIYSGGDISFRDSSANEAFYWDASAASLGIGTNSPSVFANYSTLSINGTNGSILNLKVSETETGRIQAFSGALNIAAKGASTGLIFQTNDTERMRIDSAGDVFVKGGRLIVRESDDGNDAVKITRDADEGFVQLLSNGTQTVEIRGNGNSYFNGGNVGIGTSSPTSTAGFDPKLHLESANPFLIYKETDQANSWETGSWGGNYTIFNGASERMRITSGGDVLIGTTGSPNGTTYYGSAFVDGGSGLRQLYQASSTTTAVSVQRFYNPNGNVGSIQTSGSSTSYVTSSDYRLKEDWVAMEGALDRVDALKPINFAWKVDGSRVDGFLAHELQEVVPEAVTGEKDATEIRSVEVSPAVYEDVIHPAEEAILDEEGNVIQEAKEEWVEKVLVSEAVFEDQEFPVYQGIDQSKIVPLLVAAIQELRAELNALKQA